MGSLGDIPPPSPHAVSPPSNKMIIPCPKCLNGFDGIPVCTDPPCSPVVLEEENAAPPHGTPEGQESPVSLPEYDESIEDLIPGAVLSSTDHVAVEPQASEIPPAEEFTGDLKEEDIENLTVSFAAREPIQVTDALTEEDREILAELMPAAPPQPNQETVVSTTAQRRGGLARGRGRPRQVHKPTPPHDHNLRSKKRSAERLANASSESRFQP